MSLSEGKGRRLFKQYVAGGTSLPHLFLQTIRVKALPFFGDSVHDNGYLALQNMSS